MRQRATRTGSGGNAAAKNREKTPTTYDARAHATGVGNAAGAASRSNGGTATGRKHRTQRLASYIYIM